MMCEVFKTNYHLIINWFVNIFRKLNISY